MINSRELSWNMAAGIVYSFILTFLMLVAYGLVKLFYPPTTFSIIPLISLVVSPALGIIQFIFLGLAVAFVFPVRTVTEKNSLLTIRKLSIAATISYLVISLLPLAVQTSYIQTYIGLAIAADIINGVLAGFIASYF
jgi:hypothetical protein